MQKIEINIDRDTLKGMDIGRNTIFMLKTNTPLSINEYDIMYSTIKDIIYRQTKFSPSIFIMPYGVELEILPDDAIIEMITQLKDIMNKRAGVC